MTAINPDDLVDGLMNIVDESTLEEIEDMTDRELMIAAGIEAGYTREQAEQAANEMGLIV